MARATFGATPDHSAALAAAKVSEGLNALPCSVTYCHICGLHIGASPSCEVTEIEIRGQTLRTDPLLDKSGLGAAVAAHVSRLRDPKPELPPHWL